MMRRCLLAALLTVSCGTNGPSLETIPYDLASPDLFADHTVTHSDRAGGPDDALTIPTDAPAPHDTQDTASDTDLHDDLEQEVPTDPCSQAGLCDDGILCTVDLCHPVTGCTHTPEDGLCPPEPCSIMTCDSQLGCLVEPASGSCDDGDPCTHGESCQDGFCVPATIQLSLDCLYDALPNIPTCDPGILSAGAQAVALARVNQLRALSGVPAVAYDGGSPAMMQDTALIMAANSALSHEPPQQWKCWTETGYSGAGASNLHLLWNTEAKLPDPMAAVDAFLIDKGVESLGHRRWLLDPFLKQTAFGAVHGKPAVSSPYPHAWAAALRVIYTAVVESSAKVDFVAYPMGDYPSSLVDKEWYLSFSMLASKKKAYDNLAVDLSQASVKVTKAGGGNMTVTALTKSNAFYGNPNHLQWKVIGLQDNITYKVAVSGLKYQDKSYDFQYDFRLIP